MARLQQVQQVALNLLVAQNRGTAVVVLSQQQSGGSER